MTTTITDLDHFKALDPFFRIIEKGLDGRADGGHFFDLLAEEVMFGGTVPLPARRRRKRQQRKGDVLLAGVHVSIGDGALDGGSRERDLDHSQQR
jgi:hypothetical protein